MDKLKKMLHSATRKLGGEKKAKRIAILSIVAVILVTLVSATFIINTSDNSVAEDIDKLSYALNGDGTATVTGLSAAGAAETKIKIPENVTDIGGKGYSVTAIGDSAFYECTTLDSVTIPNSVTYIGVSAFCRTGLESVIIPNSVTSIGDSAFYECTTLDSVTISNSVTSIGDYAFYSCTGLTSVTIPNSVTTIGKSAFSDCSGLTSVTIPNSVTTIGYQAFQVCTSLTSITVGVNNPNYSSIDGVLFNKDKTTLIQYPEKKSGNMYEIPNSVTTIGDYAFYDCTGLTSVTIPNSATSIGIGAFSDCSGLTSVTIPNSVTTIGVFAFYNCTGLTSVTIPNSVTTIVNNAFLDCSSLVNVIITGTGTAPTSGDVISNYFKDTKWGLPGRTTGIITLTFEFSSGYAYDLSGITTIATGKIIFGTDAKATIGGEFYTADGIPITGASRAGLTFFCIDGKWKEKPFELSFDPNGGTVTPTSKKVARGSAIGDLPTPTKDGYKFVKWQIDGTDITSETIWTYDGNKTAKAVFEVLPTPDPVDPVNPSPPSNMDVSNVLYIGFAVLLTILLASLVAVLLRSKNN